MRETDSLKPDEHQTILEFKDKLQLTRWEEYFNDLKQSDWVGPAERLANKSKKAEPVEA